MLGWVAAMAVMGCFFLCNIYLYYSFTDKAVLYYNCKKVKTFLIRQPGTPCTTLVAGSVSGSSHTAQLQLNILAYPNPSTSTFALTLQGGDDRNLVEIRVFDMNGKAVYQARGSLRDTYRFGDAFAGGMYIAEALNSGQVARIKLVKQQ